MKTKVINMFGGPGVGKSTIATGLFSAMKQRRMEVEYVSEYAKEITWEKTNALLDNQIHVFAEQFRRQFRLLGKVNWIVTDSPLVLSAVYFNKYAKDQSTFTDSYLKLCEKFFMESFNQFDNRNIVIERSKLYNPNGRNQTLEQAIEIDQEIVDILLDFDIDYREVWGSESEIIQKILEGL
jgi:hypothetical protein